MSHWLQMEKFNNLDHIGFIWGNRTFSPAKGFFADFRFRFAEMLGLHLNMRVFHTHHRQQLWKRILLPSALDSRKFSCWQVSINKLTLYGSWIAEISTLKFCSSILPTCNRRRFQLALGSHWILQPVSFISLSRGTKNGAEGFSWLISLHVFV